MLKKDNNLKIWKDALLNEELITSLKMDKRCPFTRELNIFYSLPWIIPNLRKINVKTGKFVSGNYNLDDPDIVDYMYDNEYYCRFLEEVYDKGKVSEKDWNYQQLITLSRSNTLYIDFYNRILELSKENHLLSKEELEYKELLQEFFKDNLALMKCTKRKIKSDIAEYTDYNNLIKTGVTNQEKIDSVVRNTGEYVAIEEIKKQGYKSFDHSTKLIGEGQGVDLIAYDDKLFEYAIKVKTMRCIMPINDDILDFFNDEFSIPFTESKKLFRPIDMSHCQVALKRIYLPPLIDITTPLNNTNSLTLYPYKDKNEYSLKTGEIGKINKGDYLFRQDKQRTSKNGYVYVKERFRGYVPVR